MALKYTKIKGINKRVSQIGFGCWQLGGHGWGKSDPTELLQTTLLALERGITFFDTAPIYGLGLSETRLGVILKEHHHRVVIASKVGLKWETNDGFRKQNDLSSDQIKVEIETSLKRLDVDYIDLYQIHWPDPNTPIEITLESLNELKDEGLIKAIGVCNFTLKQLIEATHYTEIASIQIPYSLIDRSYENVLDFCLTNNISVISYSPLAKGLLAGKFNKLVSFPNNDHRNLHPYFSNGAFNKNLKIAKKVANVAKKVDMTPAQCALIWILNQRAISTVIFGATSRAQVEENTKINYSKISKTISEIITKELK